MSKVLLAKGGGGGGHASSGGRSSSSSSSSGRSSSGSSSKGSTSSGSSSSKPAAPKTGTSTAKPGSTIKTSDGKSVKSSTAKPTNSKYTNSKGVVGDNGYTPRFTSGYAAPAGSVVYYPQHSALDYLPWVYLFSQNSPQNDQATVVQPDGKQVVAKPDPQGVDGLAVVNWIMLVIIVIAIIGGIVFIINKISKGKTSYATL